MSRSKSDFNFKPIRYPWEKREKSLHQLKKKQIKL
jgi:hypothetical protein